MPYYDTIKEDLDRAREILKEGRAEFHLPPEMQSLDTTVLGGTIFGKDVYAAYKLLESFVAEIERLRVELETVREEKRRQFQMLQDIRTLADRATGTNRQAGDQRESGALGAVRLLVAKLENRE